MRRVIFIADFIFINKYWQVSVLRVPQTRAVKLCQINRQTLMFELRRRRRDYGLSEQKAFKP